ncbi:hypothetical protein CC1G_08280 [Coprinopsis cinerea okayama7|uniref:Uncharacterized protein n=1 Tax=Coprinopsis cinerea (strain Okayama-7 / 130 / ATCC MYA-4618 / FGSC 9003) TaxID=240176 RepID=A8PG34_COPC7|nr:hypothetical protein CC1G_08280 [Coprinopsis cinerea okayama7\|eukprot:XP_001841136.1 hypothetical protein CC1G_08280 [Coprinopsis cinerea okayama7\
MASQFENTAKKPGSNEANKSRKKKGYEMKEEEKRMEEKGEVETTTSKIDPPSRMERTKTHGEGGDEREIEE